VFSFITKRPLWVNLLFALALFLLVAFLFFSSLTCLTRHGKVLKIPEVTGKKFAEAKKDLEAQGFEVILQDSLYIDSLPPLSVIKQFPEGDDLVKINRAVYLTVNRSVPPLVDMPDLVGKSIRIALMTLDQYGFKLGDTTFKPDFAVNSILEQTYKGSTIKPGTKIPVGSVISLVIASGSGNEDMSVPNLIGLTYGEARALLDANGLGVLIIPDRGVKDTINAYVFKQNPERMTDDKKINRIRPGQIIDLWLSIEKKVLADSTQQLQPGDNY
jgi:eukaryotic-like serine/threonine-protein kinase